MPSSLCKLKQRVLIYNGRKKSIPATVVGMGFHEKPGNGIMQTSCIVLLDTPFETPEGLYVRYLVIHPGEFRVDHSHKDSPH